MASKYTKGEVITSLDELVKQDVVIVSRRAGHNHTQNRSWISGWQIGYARQEINKGTLFKAYLKGSEEEGMYLNRLKYAEDDLPF